MARNGIGDLPKPSTFACAALKTAGFELVASARRENDRRVRSLRSPACLSSPLIDGVGAAALANELEHIAANRWLPGSLASPLTMGRQRHRVAGNLIDFVGLHDDLELHPFTLIKAGHVTQPSNLLAFEPRKYLQSIRSDLMRCGAGSSTGGLICFVHGDFELGRQCFLPHAHGLAVGDMVGVIDALRKRDAYRPVSGMIEGTVPVRCPIQVKRKPCTDWAKTLSYMLRSYWPTTWIGPVDENGKFPRNTREQRIPEPYHALWLQWIDRLRLGDISLLMGLEVGPQGFRLNTRTAAVRA